MDHEPIGFAFGVLGPLESLVRDLKNRFRNNKEAPGMLDDIGARFKSCDESLYSLNGMLDQGWPRGFPKTSKEICEKDFANIVKLANSCKKQIEDLQETFSVDPNLAFWAKSFVKVKRVAKTNRIMEKLNQLDAESKKIESYVRSFNGLLAKSFQTADLVQPSTGADDRFIALFKLPCLSGFEVLDFMSLETPEGKLKDLLLNQKTDMKHVTAALGGAERKTPLSGLVGMGGVGKTSALIGLGYDDDVRRRFLTASIFYPLGNRP